MSSVKVKICGLTRAADVDVCLEAGVDALGLVFARSPRRIDAPSALELSRLVAGRALVVGLFMDQSAEQIESVLQTVPLDLLQFHGREENLFCRGFGLPFLKAIPMANANAGLGFTNFPDAQGLLFDGHATGSPGGSGKSFDWRCIPDVPQQVWLAGGLHPGNVAEAVGLVRPWAVDVSSGVEIAPGIKSNERVREFVRAAKSAGGGKENRSGRE